MRIARGVHVENSEISDAVHAQVVGQTKQFEGGKGPCQANRYCITLTLNVETLDGKGSNRLATNSKTIKPR
jgi:hypothetical protein